MSDITREEFNQSLGRIHDKIDNIGKTGIQIETSAKIMQESVNKMCDCIYGNGKDGITSKITRLFERISLHTKLITITIGSIIGLSFYVLQSFLVKK